MEIDRGDKPEMKAIQLLLLTVMLATSVVNGDLFTALVDLEKLLHAEQQAAQHLRQFVDEQRDHLRLLTMYVAYIPAHQFTPCYRVTSFN